MSMTDPIADFLTRVRNAIRAAHETVEIPASKQKSELARILDEQGYIDSWSVLPAPDGSAGALIQIRLKYTEDRRSAISGLRRISRPGQRTYVDAKHIPRVLGGMGTSIISTSHGVMTGHDARAAGVGGEILAQVWRACVVSRIGRQPIPVPARVTVSLEHEHVRVNRPPRELP